MPCLGGMYSEWREWEEKGGKARRKCKQGGGTCYPSLGCSVKSSEETQKVTVIFTQWGGLRGRLAEKCCLGAVYEGEEGWGFVCPSLVLSLIGRLVSLFLGCVISPPEVIGEVRPHAPPHIMASHPAWWQSGTSLCCGVLAKREKELEQVPPSLRSQTLHISSLFCEKDVWWAFHGPTVMVKMSLPGK